MPYAIVEIGGKQYRVEEGDSILVDRVGEDAGAKVAPRAVLYADGGNAVMDGADLGKVKVEAVVAEHLKGPKVRVFTYRPKKRHRRRLGHRSALSRLEIRKITGPSAARRRSAEKKDGDQKPARKPATKSAEKES
jgi:large subunit ribosomal protein L21